MAKKYGCPNPECLSTTGFTSDETVLVTADINGFDQNGDPEYAGESEVCWDTQELNKYNPTPYSCDACGFTFLKPSLNEVDEVK
jgi:hypothetical protein